MLVYWKKIWGHSSGNIPGNNGTSHPPAPTVCAINWSQVTRPPPYQCLKCLLPSLPHQDSLILILFLLSLRILPSTPWFFTSLTPCLTPFQMVILTPSRTCGISIEWALLCRWSRASRSMFLMHSCLQPHKNPPTSFCPVGLAHTWSQIKALLWCTESKLILAKRNQLTRCIATRLNHTEHPWSSVWSRGGPSVVIKVKPWIPFGQILKLDRNKL